MATMVNLFSKSYDPVKDDFATLLSVINNRFIDECEKRKNLEQQYQNSLLENIKLQHIIDELKEDIKVHIASEANLKIANNLIDANCAKHVYERNNKENDSGNNQIRETDDDLLDSTLKPGTPIETFCPEIIFEESFVGDFFLEPSVINITPRKHKKISNSVPKSPVFPAKFKKKKIQKSPAGKALSKYESLIDSPQKPRTRSQASTGGGEHNINILATSPEKMKQTSTIDKRKKLSPLSLNRSPKKLNFLHLGIEPITSLNGVKQVISTEKLADVNVSYRSPSMLQQQPNYFELESIGSKMENSSSFFKFGEDQSVSNEHSIINSSQKEFQSGFLSCDKIVRPKSKRNTTEKSKKIKKMKQTFLSPKSFQGHLQIRKQLLDVTSFKEGYGNSNNFLVEETFCDEVLSLQSVKRSSNRKEKNKSLSKNPKVVIEIDSESFPENLISCSEPITPKKSKSSRTTGRTVGGEVTTEDRVKIFNTRKRLSSIDADELLNEVTSPGQNRSQKKIAKREADSSINFQYVRDAVRKKVDRQKLPGWACDDCMKYYENQNLSDDELRDRMNKCSRHRDKFNPNQYQTPPGFWNLSFPATQEENKTQVGPPLRKKII